jgi:hypothetical protein
LIRRPDFPTVEMGRCRPSVDPGPQLGRRSIYDRTKDIGRDSLGGDLPGHGMLSSPAFMQAKLCFACGGSTGVLSGPSAIRSNCCRPSRTDSRSGSKLPRRVILRRSSCPGGLQLRNRAVHFAGLMSMLVATVFISGGWVLLFMGYVLVGE